MRIVGMPRILMLSIVTLALAVNLSLLAAQDAGLPENGAAKTTADVAAPADGTDPSHQSHQRWNYFHTIPLQEAAGTVGAAAPEDSAADSAWWDFILTPAVFSDARTDLGDLRLVDATGQDVHYALRVRTPEYRDEKIAAAQFNEVLGANGSREWSYDLGANPPEHNQLEVETTGDEFRRRAVVEGSDDGQNWLKLTERQLLHFHSTDARQKDLHERHLRYSPSRYRYLRLKVDRDPLVDKDPVEVTAVHVHRRIEVAGETTTQTARIDRREPTRAWNAPASSWILHLPGIQQPFTKLRVEFGDTDFARNYQIEVAGPATSSDPFRVLASGEWQRRPGDLRTEFEAEVPASTAARVRLTIVDHSNAPLELRAASIEAPARQIVFARHAELAGPLRLYYGNPKAEAPHYDLERNLPADLRPVPLRLSLGPQAVNPVYEPEPLPLSERLPWLIYVVLAAASVAVAVILFDIGRSSIARYDALEVSAGQTSS